MAEVLSFYQLKTKRDVTLEKKLLRTLSLQQVTAASEKFTKKLFPFADDPAGIMSDGCIDFAIEAFLAGGRYGESSKYGESFDDIKKRSFQEEAELIEELAGCLQSWGICSVWSGRCHVYIHLQRIFKHVVAGRLS